MPYYPYEYPWSALTVASRGGFQQPRFDQYDWSRQNEPQPFYGDVPQQPQPMYPADPGYGQFPANPGFNQPQGDFWGQYYGPMPGQGNPEPEPELKEFKSDPDFEGRINEMDRWLEDAGNI